MMSIKSVIPVKGVPFCNKARVIKTIEILQRNTQCIIIDIDSKTFDAPYSDTFTIKECWIVVEVEGAREETCLFQRLMKIDFVKYTMFRSKITTQAEYSMIELSKDWFTLAKEGEHLTRPEPESEEEETQKPPNM